MLFHFLWSFQLLLLSQGKENGDQDAFALLMDSSYRIHAVIRGLARVVWQKTVTSAVALGWKRNLFIRIAKYINT